MVCVVRCQNKLLIPLPAGIKKELGESVPCPEKCEYKPYCRCSGTEFFNVEDVEICSDEEVAKKPISEGYSAEELSTKWNITPATTSPSGNTPIQSTPISKPSSDIPPTPQPESSVNTGSSSLAPSSQNLEQLGNVHESAASRWAARLSRNANPNENKNPESDASSRLPSTQQDPESLISTKTYDRFMIGRDIYSDDPIVKSKFVTQPLKNALGDIFRCWETALVFRTESELDDAFIWLLTEVAKKSGGRIKIKKGEIDDILENSNYSIGQKFFYLFYDVIYKNDPLGGFYWCDKRFSSSPLLAYFKNRRDFVAKYCDGSSKGQAFRAFYQNHKQEILYFLRAKNEDTFFDDLVLEIAKYEKEIVLIDKYNNNSLIRLGTINEFVKNMQYPLESKYMSDMISFLKRYRVTKLGVFVRDAQYPFDRSERGNLKEDQSMYDVLPLKSSSYRASDYDNYVTILREYVREFTPEKVKIGHLEFTRANFSEDIETLVKDFCYSHFGQCESAIKSTKKSCVWLVKSLYERKILCNFRCENSTYIDKLMDLIETPSCEKYFSLFETPKFRINGVDLTIREYIERKMDEDIYTLSKEFDEDEIIRKYFEIKILDPNKCKMDMDEQFEYYQKQYEDFINM